MQHGASERFFAAAFVFGSAGFFFATIAALAIHGLMWLHDGYWTQFPIRALLGLGQPLPDPNFSWEGVEKIAVWVLDAPDWSGLLATSLALLWFAFSAENRS